MPSPTPIALATILGFLTAANCTSPGARLPGSRAAASDTLIAGCSGGITGGGTGVAVTGGGDLLTWSRRGPAPLTPDWRLVGHDETVAQRLFSRLGTVKFDATDFNDPGNMTCFLAHRRADRSHEVAWPIGQRPARIIAIVALYDDVRKAVAAREGNR